ncbi:MAG: ATP-binding protein [Polyangiaceae bacterium]
MTTESQDPTTPKASEYDSNSITVLEGLEAVRKRPGMYIGDVHDGSALHHLVWEAVDNAVDEHLAGHCKVTKVVVHFDGSITVEDDGRGIPVGIMPDRGVSAAEVVMTVLHAGGKFDHSSYKVSAGLHGVGVSAVNAVSEWLRLEIQREGKVWFQEYRRGVSVRGPSLPSARATAPAPRSPSSPITRSSRALEYSYDILANRLRELAFLNSGLVDRAERRARRRSQRNLRVQGRYLRIRVAARKSKEPVHDDVIAFNGEFPAGEGKANVAVDCALQWTNASPNTSSVTRTTSTTKDGGTHLTGLRSALTSTLNNYGSAKPVQGRQERPER